MGLFAPDIVDTPEDRGRLPALDAEAVRRMAAFTMVSKARIRRFAELNADDDSSGSEDDSDAEELEERARRKRKSMCSPVLPCLGRLHGQQRWAGAHWCGDGAAGRETLHAGHRVYSVRQILATTCVSDLGSESKCYYARCHKCTRQVA